MKKWIFGAVLLLLVAHAPMPSMAEVDIRISIPLPPLLVLPVPPAVVVIPDTDNVYAAAEIDFDLFFWGGWWWRPWEGRWYRSQDYDREWTYYGETPAFYIDVDPGWRGFYRSRYWHGYRWDHQPIAHRVLQSNWRHWHDSRYWEKHNAWHVRDYSPRPRGQRVEVRQYAEPQRPQKPRLEPRNPPPTQTRPDVRGPRVQDHPQIRPRSQNSEGRQTWQTEPRQHPPIERRPPQVQNSRQPQRGGMGGRQNRPEHQQRTQQAPGRR